MVHFPGTDLYLVMVLLTRWVLFLLMVVVRGVGQGLGHHLGCDAPQTRILWAFFELSQSLLCLGALLEPSPPLPSSPSGWQPLLAVLQLPLPLVGQLQPGGQLVLAVVPLLLLLVVDHGLVHLTEKSTPPADVCVVACMGVEVAVLGGVPLLHLHPRPPELLLHGYHLLLLPALLLLHPYPQPPQYVRFLFPEVAVVGGEARPNGFETPHPLPQILRHPQFDMVGCGATALCVLILSCAWVVRVLPCRWVWGGC